MIQLPSELLIDIFLLACADSTHGVEQRLQLAQVCAYWRAVALDYPTFWAHIVVRTSRDATQISIALLRSRDSLLDVELHAPRFQRILSGAKEQAVVDALIAPKQRLRLKRLVMTSASAKPLLALLGTGLEFPALEVLELRRIFKEKRLSLCFEAPLLRRLVLSQLNLRTWDNLITTSLQRLDLDGRAMDDIPQELLLTILHRCTALRHLEWNVPCDL
ncbi:hypothetical protein EXIGLDRAFT_77627 [Exidia glandulosa HHB12029]|uniref:F-box domain-containing protein n=1 Tax=Exidia glandulosa HHB12029 TaxID=1314781 RepID=A0A166BII0_EXIGL|nr:hypothetical protein EXIGLDRAFT_77627 [Exidia glandulosa HHB12029]